MNNAQNRNITIDVIKGFLILFVIFGHINIDIKTRRILLAPFWENSAVPMFLLISSYLYSKGFIKNDIRTYEEAYSLKRLMPKLLRFAIPWIIFYIFEVLIFTFMRSNLISSVLNSLYPNNAFIETYVPIVNNKNVLINFILGGDGPGSYYVPLMFIFIFVFPLLYFFVRKYKKKSLFICALVSIAFNLLYLYFNLSIDAPIGTIICSLFTISIGIYWAIYDFNLRKSTVITIMAVGILYIVMVKYLDYTPLIFGYGSSRALPSCLFWMPIVIYLVKRNLLKNKFISKIGKMSFDVMLVQKVFFTFPKVIIYTLTKSLLLQIILIFLIIICLSFLFNKIELKIASIVTNRILK